MCFTSGPHYPRSQLDTNSAVDIAFVGTETGSGGAHLAAALESVYRRGDCNPSRCNRAVRDTHSETMFMCPRFNRLRADGDNPRVISPRVPLYPRKKISRQLLMLHKIAIIRGERKVFVCQVSCNLRDTALVAQCSFFSRSRLSDSASKSLLSS